MRRKFAVLTSGGDAPGMNAAIRSIVRVTSALGHEVLGIQRGYQGLLAGDMQPLDPRDVSQILEKGGTVLRTARSEAFHTEGGLRQAAAALENRGVEALFVIGGDGTFRGGVDLARYWNGQILGIPGTIDNDLWGTDNTIGFDTAVNTALNAIAKIRDTADSHERFFLIEVMGRRSGFIALEVALTSGAEEFLVPEVPFSFESLCEKLHAAESGEKTGGMLVVAEGAYPGGAHSLADKIRKSIGVEYRVCVLGHIQRGGSPTAADRRLATRLGAFAVEAVVAGENGKMIGEQGGLPVLVDLARTFTEKKALDAWMIKMALAFSVR